MAYSELFEGISLQTGDDPALHHGVWRMEDITTTIFKCTRWQVEEATYAPNCPYHYSCTSKYEEDYPWIIGFIAFLFVSFCFISTMAFTMRELVRSLQGSGNRDTSWKRKYLVPSGPILLPLVLLILAKGQRISTSLPVYQLGPAVLQILQVSALAFRNEADSDVRYTMLEASAMSGLLHASLYLDAVLLPYYTGLEALKGASLSSQCTACMCRRNPLVIGGTTDMYRGLSGTTLMIIFSLCSRMVCRLYGEEKLSLVVKSVLEGISWTFLANDSVCLLGRMLPGDEAMTALLYSGSTLLIFLNVFMNVHKLLSWLQGFKTQLKSAMSMHNNIV